MPRKPGLPELIVFVSVTEQSALIGDPVSVPEKEPAAIDPDHENSPVASKVTTPHCDDTLELVTCRYALPVVALPWSWNPPVVPELGVSAEITPLLDSPATL